MLNEKSRSQARYLVAAAALVGLTVWSGFGRSSSPPSATNAAVLTEAVSPSGVYDPVVAGEPLPDGFRQVLPRDAIAPVYNPEFLAAEDVRWEPQTQVIGVAIDGEAKAYPVSFLNGREMVIDEIADVPIVVTW